MTPLVVRARGRRRALGHRQGAASAELIAAAVGFYEELAAAESRDLDAMAAHAVSLLDHARTAAPGTVEELEGIAEASGGSLESVALLNCLEEVWAAEACTTMVAGRFLLHAEQWYAGHGQVVIVVAEPDDGPAFASPTCAGLLPAVGLSASGFAQGIDSLTADDERDGVPRVIVSREALGADGLDAAMAAARMPGRAGGYAHVLLSGGRTLTLETTAERAFVLENARAHTNHYLALQAARIGSAPSPGSLARLRRARELVVDDPPASLQDCARLLSDHDGAPDSICRHGSGLGSEATVFGMACDVVDGVMIVSDGPPCEGRWTELAVPGYRRPTRVV